MNAGILTLKLHVFDRKRSN